MGYLDSAGLSHFTAWVKARLSGKQDALTPDGSITLQGGDIAVSLPTKAVSKAEYDAMTEEQKQAEAVYVVDEPAWEAVPLSIQEYDTDDGWHVRKWSNGYAEMWQTKTITIPYGSWVRYGQTSAYTFSIQGDSPPIRLLYTDQTHLNILSVTPDLLIFTGENARGSCLCTFGPPGADRQISILFVVSGRWK